MKSRTAKQYLLALCLGIAVGCLTLFGQKYLPVNLNFLANSVCCWLVPPFLFVYSTKPDKIHAAGICIASLFTCVLAYYLFEAWYNQHSFSLRFSIYLWLFYSVVGGAVFGLGAYFANGPDGWLKYVGLNLLPAVFLSDGISKLIHLQEYYSHMIPAVILILLIGAGLYFVINKKASTKKENIGFLAFLTALGIAGFEILFQLTI
jgi:asparagine N-glycosylation enzyme membrane subunit Stt3